MRLSKLMLTELPGVSLDPPRFVTKILPLFGLNTVRLHSRQSPRDNQWGALRLGPELASSHPVFVIALPLESTTYHAAPKLTTAWQLISPGFLSPAK